MDSDRHEICASGAGCGPNDLRFCRSKGSALRGFNGTYLSDTWLWDGSNLVWTQATPQHHPSAVTGPMLFADPNGRADLFGGFDGQFYQLTMWQWVGSDWTQLFPQTVPFARASAAVAT